MVEFDQNKHVMESTAAKVYEQMVVSGLGEIEIGAEEMGSVEEAARASKQTNYTGQIGRGDRANYYVVPKDVSIDIIIETDSDMVNAVIAEDRRDELQAMIGTEEPPKLSQHFFVSEAFIEKNYGNLDMYEVK